MENRWEPIWFEGSPLSHLDYAVDESGEVDESSMAEESGTINESEIVKSEEAPYRESEEIVKTTVAKKNIMTTLSMLILAVIPITMLK